MARVTITNNLNNAYVVPAPFGVRLTSRQTKVFTGISLDQMEQSEAFKRAVNSSSITVVVAADPTVPDVIEISPVQGALTARGANLRTDEYTNPVVADDDALKTSIATAATPRVFAGVDLNGVIGAAGEMVPPRNPTVVSTSHANVTAVAVIFAGFVRNEAGALVPQTCTINVTNGGGATDAGDRPMSVVTSITVPAQGGAAGSLQFGFGTMIGLNAKIKSRAGLIAPLRQVAAGAVVTTGTFTTPTDSAVTGYTPAAAPDGARDYALTYEVDA